MWPFEAPPFLLLDGCELVRMPRREHRTNVWDMLPRFHRRIEVSREVMSMIHRVGY